VFDQPGVTRDRVTREVDVMGRRFMLVDTGGIAFDRMPGSQDPLAEETRAQAQEDISEDGYWGVEQTSDRIVSFAKALAGDNLELAQQMLEAVKEGFKQAGEEWGEDLPEISNRTMDATYKKLDEWIKSLGGGSDDASGSTAVAAAQTTTVKISASYSRAEASYNSINISGGTDKDE
ncbi:MAG: hypothetical protein J6S72_00520, partial [Lachnospiraceae bacterium]|nr:hypothetical protein [Lachnospiraceae bacterium]